MMLYSFLQFSCKCPHCVIHKGLLFFWFLFGHPSLSSPRVPDVSVFGEVVGDAFALAVVGYAISISLGKTFALKHGYKVDSNQVRHIEHVALCRGQ